ncbi:hypothetical protein [Gluconacetobacter asukensis]|uniref:Sulfotransferase domain-containing protein n=1 Tax=Gluconacetobacter asukensis TaxID=1017181 RepID=A0A7W4J0N6_9PROT|nr:hypothetical protein [Gluconacetobacter asukensis]MBB2172563.1 hypothetical protein [Gluconacetobacter asukensis]
MLKKYNEEIECILEYNSKINSSIYNYNKDFTKLMFHDQFSLKEIFEVDDLDTDATPSFVFKENKTGKILFDHRTGIKSEKPFLIISKPRSGTHIMSNILKIIGLHHVCVFLDHMDTYCYRLDEEQKLIHQLPTGIPLFISRNMFLQGQFSHSHLIYSEWAAKNIPENFTVITLDRDFISPGNYVFSDMKGRIYNKIISGCRNIEVEEMLRAGIFDREIEFLHSEYKIQEESIKRWIDHSHIHVKFEDLFKFDGELCGPILKNIFGNGCEKEDSLFWSELIRRRALREESFTKRTLNAIDSTIESALLKRIGMLC